MDRPELRQSVPGESTVSPEVLKDLERSRRLLEDDRYIPEGLPEESVEAVTAIGENGERYITPDQRAFMAMNNFMQILSENIRNYIDEPLLNKPLEELDGHTYADLLRDKDAVIAELGLPAEEIKERAARYLSELDKILALYQETFPVYEKLILERGYPPSALKM